MTAKSGRDLAELWSSAIIFAPHLAGCTCNGGFHIPLDPGMVEEDLMDFLRFRYQGEGRDDLATYVGARIADRQSSFNVWLQTIDEAPLNADDRNRLIADIRTTLESMHDMGGAQRGQIVCY